MDPNIDGSAPRARAMYSSMMVWDTTIQMIHTRPATHPTQAFIPARHQCIYTSSRLSVCASAAYPYIDGRAPKARAMYSSMKTYDDTTAPAFPAYPYIHRRVLNSKAIYSSRTVQVAATVSEPVAHPHIDGRAPSARAIYRSMAA